MRRAYCFALNSPNLRPKLFHSPRVAQVLTPRASATQRVPHPCVFCKGGPPCSRGREDLGNAGGQCGDRRDWHHLDLSLQPHATTDISPCCLRVGLTVISTSCPSAVRNSMRR